MRFFILSCLYVLAAFGLAFIVGYAKISLPLRGWLGCAWGSYTAESGLQPIRFAVARRALLELLQCPACLGVWIGFAFALADPLMFGAAAALGVDHLPLMERAFFLGLATCASNFILGALTGLIEVH